MDGWQAELCLCEPESSRIIAKVRGLLKAARSLASPLRLSLLIFLIVGQMCAYTDQIVSGGVYSKCWQGVFEMVKELVGAQPVSCLREATQESSQKDQTGVFWTKCFSVTGDWEKYVRYKLAAEIGMWIQTTSSHFGTLFSIFFLCSFFIKTTHIRKRFFEVTRHLNAFWFRNIGFESSSWRTLFYWKMLVAPFILDVVIHSECSKMST